MSDALAVIFGFAVTAFFIGWFTLFPTIGVFWLLGWLS